MNTIKKVHQLSEQATIGQITSVSKTAAGLLHSIGLKPKKYIDKTLTQVCAEMKWSEEEVLSWIKQKNIIFNDKFKNESELASQIGKMGFTERTQLCYTTYHDTIFELLDDVNRSLPRVYQVHGIQDHSLKLLEREINLLSDRIKLHLKFQKNRFFRQLQKFESEKKEVTDGVVQGLIKSIQIIRQDQMELSERMEKIGKFANQYELSEHTCSTHRIMIKNLEALVGIIKEMNIEIENSLSQPLLKKLN